MVRLCFHHPVEPPLTAVFYTVVNILPDGILFRLSAAQKMQSVMGAPKGPNGMPTREQIAAAQVSHAHYLKCLLSSELTFLVITI